MATTSELVCSKCNSTKFHHTWCGSGETYYTCANYECMQSYYADGFKKQTNLQLHKRIRTLEKSMKEIIDKLDKLYYSPGMPGYIEAKNDYEIIEPKIEKS